jgi:asparagine synthase (glutamine-hydrolysing)
MPGIAGIIEKGFREDNEDALQAMVKCMIHEKFYSSGTYAINRLGLRLGWVCLKDSFSDCMPVWNERKDICLIFIGEDATDESEIGHLKADGHQCNLENASYLVHLYEEEGIGFLKKINGWFSGVLVDLREEIITLFNDRYGLNRIYYHENKEAFYFSSEAKSLLKIMPNLRQFDYSSLGEFFSYGCTLENKTLFSGVSLVPGGSMWRFSPRYGVARDTYFKPEILENQFTLNERNYYERLKETFTHIISKYFRQRERIAVSLTGGINSRMIMAWAPCPPLKVPCYTFSGMYRDCADVNIARQVARICQQRHKTIRLNRKFYSEFPALAKRSVYYTDGTMNVSGSVDLYVNRLARETAPIRVTGNYGDQVLRRSIGFKHMSLCEEIFDMEFIHFIRQGVMTYDKINKDPMISFLAFKQVPWYDYARLALERTQLTVRSPYLDNDLLSLVYQAPPESAASVRLSLRLIAEGNPALGRIPTDLGLRYRSVPVATTAQSLFRAFTSKAEYAYDYGMPQWLAKVDNLFSSLHLEKAFLGRHKFYHFSAWYRDALSKYVRDILLDPRTLRRPYLNGSCIEAIIREHTSGRRNYTNEIHFLLTSELIQRHLIGST